MNPFEVTAHGYCWLKCTSYLRSRGPAGGRQGRKNVDLGKGTRQPTASWRSIGLASSAHLAAAKERAPGLRTDRCGRGLAGAGQTRAARSPVVGRYAVPCHWSPRRRSSSYWLLQVRLLAIGRPWSRVATNWIASSKRDAECTVYYIVSK